MTSRQTRKQQKKLNKEPRPNKSTLLDDDVLSFRKNAWKQLFETHGQGVDAKDEGITLTELDTILMDEASDDSNSDSSDTSTDSEDSSSVIESETEELPCTPADATRIARNTLAVLEQRVAIWKEKGEKAKFSKDGYNFDGMYNAILDNRIVPMKQRKQYPNSSDGDSSSSSSRYTDRMKFDQQSSLNGSMISRSARKQSHVLSGPSEERRHVRSEKVSTHTRNVGGVQSIRTTRLIVEEVRCHALGSKTKLNPRDAEKCSDWIPNGSEMSQHSLQMLAIESEKNKENVTKATPQKVEVREEKLRTKDKHQTNGDKSVNNHVPRISKKNQNYDETTRRKSSELLPW